MSRISKVKKSLLLQYFISYLVVMTILSVGVFSYVYRSLYKHHMEIISREHLSTLELIRERNESEFLMLLNSSTQLAASNDLSPFIFLDNPEKSLGVKRQLKTFSVANDFFSELYLIFEEDDYVYSKTSVYQLDKFADSAMILDGMTPQELKEQFRTVRWFEVLPEQMYDNGQIQKKIIPVFMPIGYPEGGKNGTIMYQIDSTGYDNMLGSIASGEKDVYVLKNKELIYGRQVSGIPYETALNEAAKIYGEASFTEFQYNNRNYFAYFMEGEKLDLDYLMITSANDMSLAFTSEMKFFMIIMTLIFTFCMVIVAYFVQRRVKPIRKLHKLIVSDVSAGNELIEIREGVQKLIDDNITLNARVENTETWRKADFARRFLVGGFNDDSEWLSKAEEINLNVDINYFIVSIIAKPIDSDYELTTDKVNRLFDDTVSGISCMIGLNRNIVMVAFADDGENLFEWTESKLYGMKAICPGITVAASDLHTDYIEGPIAYLEAENAFETRFLRGNEKVIRFRRTCLDDPVGEAYDSRVVERLQKALKSLDLQGVRRALDDIKRFMKNTKTSLFVFRCMYNDILNVITKEMKEGNSIEQEMHDLYKLSECLSLDELDAMLFNVCSRIIASQDRFNDDKVPEHILKAMNIIKKRFSAPGISVSLIACELGISESKLSVDFKAAYNMTPHECLTNYRMQLARELLESTGMPVKDISSECGYYEISAFNRRFKAYNGKTPQQYRQSTKE